MHNSNKGSDSVSRVKLHWERPANYDVIKQEISIRIHDSYEHREIIEELPYDQCHYELNVRVPCRIEYIIDTYNSAGDHSKSETFSRQVNQSILPSPATNLTADIVDTELPADSFIPGTPFYPQRRENTRPYVTKRPAPARNDASV